MCCLFTVLVFLGPRAGILVWWLLQPARWNAAFTSFIWQLLGFIFVPWTTIMYVLVFPGGRHRLVERRGRAQARAGVFGAVLGVGSRE
jgi:hypothetical protein